MSTAHRVARFALLLALAAPFALAQTSAWFPVVAGSGPQEVAPAPGGGPVYFSGQRNGTLGILDPASRRVEEVRLGARSAPRGVVVGPDGAPWLADAGLNAIVRVDPATRAVRTWPLPSNWAGANLASAVFDREGRLWFTGESGWIGRLDPSSSAWRVWPAPRGNGPYGIAATPTGGIWFVSSAGNYLASIDTETGRIEIAQPPPELQGARRVASDSTGRLWVSFSSSGHLGMYDPARRGWQAWRVPGGRPQANAVWVDERDIVWLSDGATNAILRFEPSTALFTPIPSEGAARERRPAAWPRRRSLGRGYRPPRRRALTRMTSDGGRSLPPRRSLPRATTRAHARRCACFAGHRARDRRLRIRRRACAALRLALDPGRDARPASARARARVHARHARPARVRACRLARVGARRRARRGIVRPLVRAPPPGRRDHRDRARSARDRGRALVLPPAGRGAALACRGRRRGRCGGATRRVLRPRAGRRLRRARQRRAARIGRVLSRRAARGWRRAAGSRPTSSRARAAWVPARRVSSRPSTAASCDSRPAAAGTPSCSPRATRPMPRDARVPRDAVRALRAATGLDLRDAVSRLPAGRAGVDAGPPAGA